MNDFNYLVYENNTLKAGFVNHIDALNYKDMLKAVNRTAGYNDKYTIKETKQHKEKFL